MAITLVSTPAYIDPADPSLICRWLATESPNNFRLLRRDFITIYGSSVNSGGFIRFQLSNSYTGSITNSITIYDATLNTTYSGKVTAIGTVSQANDLITTDMAWVPSTNIFYLNDNTLRQGYYFEGRLTINGVIYPLTIIASPDSYGQADLDVSGILRIVTRIGKTADYTQIVKSEPTKGGKFNFEYREKWYRTPDWASEEGWEGDVITSPMTSPPLMYDWYYAECVRSEEQGSNLHDYVADTLNDAPFLNQFSEPVYFRGLPFDLTFIMPETAIVSPGSDLTVTIKYYNSLNILLSTTTTLVTVGLGEGKVVSLWIDSTTVPVSATYLTAEISF